MVNAVVPDIAGGVRALSIAMTDQATGVIGARERNLITAPQSARDEFRFWGQEFYNIVRANNTAATPGYGGAGQGIALGVEWGNIQTGRYGVGYTFFSSQETESHPRDTKTNGDWNLVSAYGAGAPANSSSRRRSISGWAIFIAGARSWQALWHVRQQPIGRTILPRAASRPATS